MRFYLSPFQTSLAGIGFDSKCNSAPPTILLVSPLPLDVGYFFGGIKHSLLMVVQQLVAVLEFSQGKVSAISFYSAIFILFSDIFKFLIAKCKLLSHSQVFSILIFEDGTWEYTF